MTGAFFVLLYSPIKSFIMGSDSRFWPKRFRLNSNQKELAIVQVLF